MIFLFGKRIAEKALTEEDSSLDYCFEIIREFSNRHYIKLLSIAYTHLIEKIKFTTTSIDHLIKLSTDNGNVHVASGFIEYNSFCQELIRTGNDKNDLPAVGLDNRLNKLTQSARKFLKMDHNASYCNGEYHHHLANIKALDDLLSQVVEASSLENIADAISYEMLYSELAEDSELFDFLSTFDKETDFLRGDNRYVFESREILIESLVEYPILHHMLSVFFARLEEELQIAASASSSSLYHLHNSTLPD